MTVGSFLIVTFIFTLKSHRMHGGSTSLGYCCWLTVTFFPVTSPPRPQFHSTSFYRATAMLIVNK